MTAGVARVPAAAAERTQPANRLGLARWLVAPDASADRAA